MLYSNNKERQDLVNQLFHISSSTTTTRSDSIDNNNNKNVDNWNERFQNIISLPETTYQEKLLKYSSLNSLNVDFITTSSLYTRTIISEYFLNDKNLKSIHLQDLGGYAGGKKFLWHGILFKLAYYNDQDVDDIYNGNDEAAAKAMGNELKGGNSYFRCLNTTTRSSKSTTRRSCKGKRQQQDVDQDVVVDQDVDQLHVALQALIDYKGFRMHAQAQLPIDQTTLLMGTSNGSRSVHSSSILLSNLMKETSEELNLRQHYVCNKMLYSACDIEGHKGHDNKYYLVDLARTFPPEDPQQVRHLWTIRKKKKQYKQQEVKKDDVVHVRIYQNDNDYVVKEGQVMEVFDNDQVTVLLADSNNNNKNDDEVSQFVDVNWEDQDNCFGVEVVSNNMKTTPPEIITVHMNDIILQNLDQDLDKGIGKSDVVDDDEEVEEDYDKMSIFWRLLRPEFVKHRGSQLLGDDVVAGRKIDQDVDQHVDKELSFQREVSTMSSLSGGYSDQSKEDDLLMKYASVPTHLPNLSRVISLPLSSTSSSSRSSINNKEDRNIDHMRYSSWPTPSSNPKLSRGMSLPTSTSCLMSGCNDFVDLKNTFSVPEESESMLSSCCFDENGNCVHDIDYSISNDTSYQQEATLSTSERAMKKFFPTYSCAETLEVKNNKTSYCNTIKEMSWKEVLINQDNNNIISNNIKNDDVSVTTNITTTSDDTSSVILPAVEEFEDYTDLDSWVLKEPLLPPVPLSPDALSSFGATDPSYLEYDQDVSEATSLLVQKLIPAMAKDLERNGHPLKREGLSITEYMHRHGVNIRHVGLLRRHLSNDLDNDLDETTTTTTTTSQQVHVKAIRHELLMECISRTLKNILRKTQRQYMCSQRSCSEEGMMHLVIDFLNLVTSSHPSSCEFWSYLVIPGIMERFGRVALTDNEIKLPDDCSMPKLFNDYCSHDDVRLLLNRLCKRGGIKLHQDCLEHLAEGPVKGFEFAISDIVDIIPVVKHMHQVDLGEGLMLSLMGQDYDKTNSSSVVSRRQDNVKMRLMSMSVDKLHSALKAVPDDDITKQALADAYQGLAFASLAVAGMPSTTTTTSSLKDVEDNNIINEVEDRRKNRVRHITERGFELYRSLLWADEHTKCSKIGLSHQDDILGVCLQISHFKFDKYLQGGRVHGNEQLEIQRIRGVKVGLECVSLRYFQMFVDYCSSFKRKRHMNKTVPKCAKCCWRFFPLIVDPSHAERAQELLNHELVLADRLDNKSYNYKHIKKEDQNSPRPHSSPKYILPRSSLNDKIPEISPHIILRVVSAVMNSMVLKFVDDATNTGKISDTALVGFIRFHHMLLYKAHESTALQKEANKCVELFVASPLHRTKDGTPDLGRFLVYVLLSERGWDDDLRYVFLQETFCRQVAWFVKKGGRKLSLLVLEDDDVSMFRLQITFSQTMTSVRLIMFQVYFLQTVARTSCKSSSSSDHHHHDIQQEQSAAMVLHLYNASLGRPTAAMRHDYKSEFQEIMRVSNYGQYLQRLGCCLAPNQINVMLRNAIRSSNNKAYGDIPLKAMVGNANVEEVPEEGMMSWKDFEDNMMCNKDLLKKDKELLKRWNDEADTSFIKKNNNTKESSRKGDHRQQKEGRRETKTWQRGDNIDNKKKNSDCRVEQDSKSCNNNNIRHDNKRPPRYPHNDKSRGQGPEGYRKKHAAGQNNESSKWMSKKKEGGHQRFGNKKKDNKESVANDEDDDGGWRRVSSRGKPRIGRNQDKK